ncbi:MAG: hypothetical protein WBR26_20265 [Candidatus Acidiferrum sp.]
MDANNRGSAADVGFSSGGAGTAARMKRNVAREAADKLESSRQSTVGALEWTASSLHSGAEQISNLGHSAAEQLEHTADYFRETDLERIFSDVGETVKRHPGKSIAVAAVAGFLLARGLRRLIQ